MQPFTTKMSYFRRQLLLVIGVNFISLCVAGVLLFTNFVDDFRVNLVESMSSKTAMLKASSAAALLFDDTDSAEQILSTLSQSNDTRFAQIYNQQREPFATFTRPGEQVDIDASALEPGHFFANNHLYLFQSIELDGEHLGFILVSAGTESLTDQQHRYARIVLFVFAFSLLLAYGLNWRLQKVLTRPISRLVRLVDYVAKKRRYHKRMKVESKDEIGTLISGINSMLDTIQAHEKQLQDNSERLESLVALRTEQLFQRANYDALTQLPNRHLLIDRLNHGIDNAEREKANLALMFLDLDRFKIINDSLGHTIGDMLLNQVAQKLQTLVEKVDSVSRWGGDEFVILLEHLDGKEKARQLAESIINILHDPMDIAGHRLHISTSIGIACYPDDGADSMTLLKHADISMYRAKDRGPGNYCFYEPLMLDDSIQRLSMESRIRKALDTSAFHLVYQPQICINTETLCGYEALIRWNDDGEMVPPSSFLPVAEEIGLINTLSEWVLDEMCRQAAEWRSTDVPVVPVAVNLPASFIVQPNCAEIIASYLNKHGLPPSDLEVEITEDTFVSSTESAIQSLAKLRQMGIGVAVDDFGTGYSCMSYLRDLPVSKLKIDGSFVQCLGDGSVNDGIVQSIITLGRSLSMQVVGECVETAEQQVLLMEMGCHMAQGYLYSKPLEATAVPAFNHGMLTERDMLRDNREISGQPVAEQQV